MAVSQAPRAAVGPAPVRCRARRRDRPPGCRRAADDAEQRQRPGHPPHRRGSAGTAPGRGRQTCRAPACHRQGASTHPPGRGRRGATARGRAADSHRRRPRRPRLGARRPRGSHPAPARPLRHLTVRSGRRTPPALAAAAAGPGVLPPCAAAAHGSPPLVHAPQPRAAHPEDSSHMSVTAVSTAPTPVSDPHPRGLRANPWLTLIAVALGLFMVGLDGSVVSIANAEIARDLNATTAELQWVTNSYLLALAAALILGGKLGDRFGRRTVYLVGVVGFTLA